MAMHALTTNRVVSHLALIRDINKDEDGDAFMLTFDDALTACESMEWDGWARKHVVEERSARDSDMMLISLLHISPFFTSPYNRVERKFAWDYVREYLINTDSEYTDFLIFLLRK